MEVDASNNIMNVFNKYLLYTGLVDALQAIEDQGIPTDCWSFTCTQTEENEHQTV